MRPVSLEMLMKNPTYDLLDITTETPTFPWLPPPDTPQDPTNEEDTDIGSPQLPTPRPSIPLDQENARLPLEMIVRVTPGTRIWVVGERWRVVFVVDVGGSMRTVDMSEGKARVLVAEVFEVVNDVSDAGVAV
ncbi:hypothetical protein HDU67_008777 [Dinochytrium kinnereticum]|nr:hypothetical protein HDU67_008777 [Dinochytrium kinnereticum]